MRQAYDYWQDQPGSCRANTKTPFGRERKLGRPGGDFVMGVRRHNKSKSFARELARLACAPVPLPIRQAGLPFRDRPSQDAVRFSRLNARQDRHRFSGPPESSRWTALPDTRKRLDRAATQMPLQSDLGNKPKNAGLAANGRSYSELNSIVIHHFALPISCHPTYIGIARGFCPWLSYLFT